MNIVWSRFLRSPYRQEPLASFSVTAGVVAAAIGGLNEHWSLTAFGLSTVGVVIALRWWHQKQPPVRIRQAPVYALPPRSSSTSLPVLELPKRRPTDGKH